MEDRDFFAGMALAGLLAYPGEGTENVEDKVTARAFKYADAMLRRQAEWREQFARRHGNYGPSAASAGANQ